MSFIKRIMVLVFSFMIVFGSIMISTYNTNIISSIAVSPLSDNITINSSARGVIKNDYINKICYCFILVGIMGNLYVFTSKKKGEK
jgi:hypothetical protein